MIPNTIMVNAGRQIAPILSKAYAIPLACGAVAMITRRFQSSTAAAVAEDKNNSHNSPHSDAKTMQRTPRRVAHKITPGFLGSLPREDPLAALPEQYGELDSLLRRMTIDQRDGSTGLLGSGTFGDTLREELPEYDLSSVTSPRLLAALHRDLCFAASAFLLEPCDRHRQLTGSYGFALGALPRNIAVPLVTVEKKLARTARTAEPFSADDCTQSWYVLNNYRRVDQSKGHEMSNLRLVRAFDGSDSEANFVLAHVAIVGHSGRLVVGTDETLNGLISKNRSEFNVGLDTIYTSLQRINANMAGMAAVDRLKEYLPFRTYMMGAGNEFGASLFPNGVLLEGVSAKPRYFWDRKSASAANKHKSDDAIMPTCDNLFQIPTMTSNDLLTAVVFKDGPQSSSPHQQDFEWLQGVKRQARKHDIVGFGTEDAESTLKMMRVLDQVREFRQRAWVHTRDSLLRHPEVTATTNAPYWLPNELHAVLLHMEQISERLNSALSSKDITSEQESEIRRLSQQAVSDRGTLLHEVRKILNN
eukprot:Clim_evm84s215 gene=Clim_evmTU84s215